MDDQKTLAISTVLPGQVFDEPLQQTSCVINARLSSTTNTRRSTPPTTILEVKRVSDSIALQEPTTRGMVVANTNTNTSEVGVDGAFAVSMVAGTLMVNVSEPVKTPHLQSSNIKAPWNSNINININNNNINTNNNNVNDNTSDNERRSNRRGPSPHHSRFSMLQKNPFHIDRENKLALRIFRTHQAMAAEVNRQNAVTSSYTIHPYSPFKWHWDFLVVITIAYSACSLPVAVAFFSNGVSEGWFILNCIVDSVYIIDLLLNFRTGIIRQTPEGTEVILEPKAIAKIYLRSSFFIDLISSIPFDHFVNLANGEAYNSDQSWSATSVLKFLKFTKLLCLLRLLKVTKLVRVIRDIQEHFHIGPATIRMLNLSLAMIMVAHWNGCIQFLVSRLEHFPEGSWVFRDDLIDAPPGTQYAWSLFKALSHMLCIGYGQLPPTTLTECWLTIFSMLMGATFYAMFIGHMTTVMASIDTASRAYSLKVSAINEYMMAKKIPRVTRTKVTEFFEEHCTTQKWFDEEEILEGLAPRLKTEILLHSYTAIIKQIPFLCNADASFLQEIVALFEPETCIPGHKIICAQEKGTCLYLIQYGTFEVKLPGVEESVCELTEGMFFGEICFVEPLRLRTADVIATTACRVHRLPRERFLPLLKTQPKIHIIILNMALQRLSEDRTRQGGL